VELRDGYRSVRREEVFSAPRDELWSALTEAERLAAWFANEVQLDARPGGRGVFRWADGDERRATVHEVVEGERIAFTWANRDGIESLVELELADTNEGTRLVLTETAASAGAEPAVDWSCAVSLGALAQHLAPVLV
jgi:uncharacterized protein YndB with AHSA1/START domain